MPAVLTVKKLNVTFEDNLVLGDVSFTLAKGESLAIIGPNGSGKSVLIKSLLGLLPYKGEIAWAKDIRIGYVPQKIDADRHLPITLTNLLEAKARVLGIQKEEVLETCKTVGLTPQALQTPVGHLSGGQFQKGLIALALLGNPQVIILDEPTASLDQSSEEHVYELIHRLQGQYHLTVIIVSHDLSMVYHKTHKVLCLNKQMLCFGEPQKVLDPKNLKQAFGAPMDYYDHLHPTKKITNQKTK